MAAQNTLQILRQGHANFPFKASHTIIVWDILSKIFEKEN